MSGDLQVNFPRWINSSASHRGASSFQQSGGADRLIRGLWGQGRRWGLMFPGLVRSCQSLCSLGRGDGSPWGGLVAWTGDACADVEAAGKVAVHWGCGSCAVPRRRRSSQPAGEGEQVGCCF